MKPTTRLWRGLANAITAVAVLAAGACSDSNPSSAAAEGDPSLLGRSKDEIQFFASTGADTKMVSVGPDPTLWAAAGQPVLQDDGTSALLHTRDLTVQVGTPNALPTSALLRAAMLECKLPAAELAEAEFPAGDATTFYYRLHLLDHPNCDKLLETQQILICVADKLAELSEGTGPVVWQVGDEASRAGLTAGPYSFPPQNPNGRFILRDLALRTLAHVSWLDMVAMTGVSTGSTCTDLYAQAVAHPGQANLMDVFGNPYGVPTLPALPTLPSKTISSAADVRTLAGNRLAFKAHVLRTAARMIPELVTDSVYADLSGANQRKSAQGDSKRGLEALWGNATDGYYNSLAHAARVLGQRWQFPASWLPPGAGLAHSTCSSLPMNEDALELAYGDDYTARVGSLPTTSTPQSDAIVRLEATGVVFDDEALQAGAADLKSAVTEQLLFAEATDRNTDSQTFRATPAGQLLLGTFDGISDADFLFAAKAMQDRYRVLTNAGTGQWNPAATATENMAADHLASSNLAGMHVFRRPMTVTDLPIDVLAKVGGLQTVSQCTETVQGLRATGTDFSSELAMQDSFAMGQALYSRLVALRELAATASPEAKSVADAATAEVRAWSGEGRIFAVGRSNVFLPKSMRRIELTTLGFEPQDFGVSSVAEMGERLELVWGKAYIADCAAGLRSACPDDIESYIAHPTSADVRSLAGDGMTDTLVPVPNAANQLQDQNVTNARRFYGVDGTWGAFGFDISAAGSRFRPTYSGSTIPQERVYVVLRSDPRSIDGKGKVLGALSLRARNQLVATVVSKRQRELYNAVFGINRDGLYALNATGKRSLAQSEAYCLPGVPYSIFVPLENELTSDGDSYESSWRTILSQASAAASRADSLGDKMLDWGLQQELRREAANEKLAEICGSYGLVDETTFKDGKVTAGANDGPLSACLDSDVRDVVFLGEAPEGLKDASDKTEYLKTNVLNCPAPGQDPDLIQNASGLCANEELTYGELALPKLPPPPERSFDCGTTTTLLPVLLRASFPGETMKSVAQAEWIRPDALMSLVSAMQYRERIPAAGGPKAWYVVWNRTTTLMSSTGRPEGYDDAPDPNNDPGATLWPGCQIADAAICSNDRLTKAFMTIFGTSATSSTDEIAWRVQGALWTLAAMSGTVPQGMFRVQVPVADFQNHDADALLVPAIYGNGYLQWQQAGEYRLLQGRAVTYSGANALDTVHDFPSTFDYPTTDALAGPEGLYPSWLAGFWTKVKEANQSAKRPYLTVAAESNELSLGGRPYLGEDINAMADGFDTMRCPGSLFNGQEIPGVDSESARARLEAIKTTERGAWGHVCSRPHAGKEGPLTLIASGKRAVAISFQDVVLAGKCASNESAYGYSPELFPVGAPNPGDLEDSKWWYVWHGNLCADATTTPGNVAVTQMCLNLLRADPAGGWGVAYDSCSGDDGWEPKGAYSLAQWDLAPDATNCSKGKRARMFINSYPPATACDAAAQVVAAFGLACELQGAPTLSVSEVPKMTSLDQMPALGAWLAAAGNQLADQASRLYVERVPQSVLKDFSNGNVGTGSNAGSVGQTRLEMGKNLDQIRQNWRQIGDTLALIGTDIANARISQKMAENDLDTASLRIAIERANDLAKMGEAVASAAGNYIGVDPFANPGKTVAETTIAGIEVARSILVQMKLDKLKENAGVDYENSIAKTLNDLQATLIIRSATLEDSLTALKLAVASAKQQGSELDTLAAQAQYETAVAAGEDFARDSNGNAIPIPVNTILNRQYDVTRNRYRRALTEARYLAFLARVAVEQRLGERLDAVSFPTTTGPLESPGFWADDVCHMTGIDFAKYKDAPLPDWAKETPSQDAGVLDTIVIPSDLLKPKYRRNLLALFAREGTIDNLSKQYIGDYIAHLETFVTYYNTEYPSHDGDDTTVLSLRDELLVRDGLCTERSPNLLYFSGDLALNATSTDKVGEVTGWQLHSCEPGIDRCLLIVGDDGLQDPADPSDDAFGQPPVPGASVSLLTEASPPTVDAGSTPSDAVGDDAGSSGGGDFGPRTVNQRVHLSPGSYVLSWWASARSPAGPSQPGPTWLSASEDTMNMTVSVAGQDGIPVGGTQAKPYKGSEAAPWGTRSSFGFDVADDGLYTVSVSVSLAGQSAASVAMAGMQLERASSADAAPTKYVQNGATLARLTQACPLTSADVQNAFIPGRDETTGRDFWELRAPITLDTQQLATHPDYLNGKLAAGNFNYRYVNLALNAVGTGVVDCSGLPATCRDTNTIDYTLEHNALSIDLRGVNGALREFNFGRAYIHDGRALASEIEVETPVTAEYNALLQQDGVTKTEYMGRPLDGTYRLRIWDRPGLQWSRLKDVQIVLRYRYWSAIDKSSSGPG